VHQVVTIKISEQVHPFTVQKTIFPVNRHTSHAMPMSFEQMHSFIRFCERPSVPSIALRHKHEGIPLELQAYSPPGGDQPLKNGKAPLVLIQ
jgi:hypothetical protein